MTDYDMVLLLCEQQREIPDSLTELRLLACWRSRAEYQPRLYTI